MLKNEELKAEIIQLHHNMSVAGHRGRLEDNKIDNKKLLVARSYKNVGKYVESCDTYQRMKIG